MSAKAKKVTLVVLIDLGANAECSDISPASRILIMTGAEYAGEMNGDCVVAYCNPTNMPGTAMTPEVSAAIKSRLLDVFLPTKIERISVPALNSIQEAGNIRNAVADRGMNIGKIIVFCDIEHERRLDPIWRHYFPGIEIDFRSRLYVYGSDYAQFLLRSRLTWQLVNIAGLIAMKLVGIDRMANFKQPSFK